MTDEHDPYGEQDISGVPEGFPCVELEFATLRRFREEMAPYLNYDGFFARTDRPLPRGTTVEFKFCMPEDFVLARGTAVVAWTIEPAGNPDLVPGMALRFDQVGEQSRAVIDELADFHIATGGDLFDVGRRADRVGEFPTDALGGTGGGATSTIDSPAPMARYLPLSPDPERPALADDGVLPDWLSESAGLAGSGNAEAVDTLDFKDPLEEKSPAPSSPDDFDFSIESPGGGFEVDMVLDDGEEEVTPRRPEEGSFQQMAMAPRADNKPPRDLRLGLIVTAAIVLIAVIVLVWSVWLKKPGQEVVVNPPLIDEASEVGVAMIDDDVEGEDLEGGGDPAAENATENATRLAAETAARVAAKQAGDDPAQETAPAEPVVDELKPSIEEQTKVAVTEKPSQAAPQSVRQTRASRVVDVSAAARADTTTVIIRGNGAFDTAALKISRLEEPLRLWVRVFNIENVYKPNEIDVGSPEVHRVRIGYHPEDNPPALYVVLDLAGDDVSLLDQSVQGDAIRLTVGRK